MDIVGFIRSLTLTDVFIFIVLAAAFVWGYMQGVIRQLLALGVTLLAFILAANLRGPVGGWLGDNWTGFPRAFSDMVGFLLVFLVLVIAGNAAIQITYRHAPLLSAVSMADEILGGLLALVAMMLLIAAFVFVLDSYYRNNAVPLAGDVGWLRDLHGALDKAALVNFLRGGLIPGFLTLLGPLVPDVVHSLVR